MPLIRKPAAPGLAQPADAAGVFAALGNGGDDERWAAARAAADLPDSAKALGEALLRESNPRVREAILTSLARISTAQSVEMVLPLLRSDDAGLRTGALDALRTMKEPVRAYVPQLLQDRDIDVRLLACELVRNFSSEEASSLLTDLLMRETEPNVCASAIEVLAEVGGAAVLPALAACAERFRGNAFLEFSIKITSDRIRTQSSQPRA